jgi:membrane protease YdiL (CAAX protease family)
VKNKVTLIISSLIILISFLLLGILHPFEENNSLFFLFKMAPNKYILIAIIVIIVPIIEEYIFRFFIKSSNKLFLILLGILPFLLIDILIYIPVFILFFSFILFKKKNEKVIFRIFISSLVFSLVHIGNYSFYNNNYYIILPLLILFGLGNILALIRLKFGIVYSIFAHSLYNFLLLSLIYFSADNKILFSNKDYEINLTKNLFEKKQIGELILDGIGNFSFTTSELIEYKLRTNSNKNYFYLIEKSLIPYSGTFNTEKLLVADVIELLSYKVDTISEMKKGYVVDYTPNRIREMNLSLKIDSNDFMNKRTIIGYNLKQIINQISKETNTPLIVNFKDTLLSNKIKLTYFKNLNFKENIQLLNYNNSLNFSLKDTLLSTKILLIKSQ